MGAESDGRFIKTGIPGLDNITGGGLPRGGMVLLTGDTGTGKTTLAYEFLVRGALQGENGMIVTSNTPVEKFLSQLMPFSFCRGEVPGEGIKVMPMNCDHLDIDGHLEVIGGIAQAVKDAGARRLMIDPLPRSLLELEESQLVTVLNGLSSTLYDNGITTMMVTDVMHHVALSMADGVVHLEAEDREGDVLRTVQVRKLRGCAHSLSRYAMMLSKEGTIMSRLIRRSWE
jgi:circadian clock protein KaiC